LVDRNALNSGSVVYLAPFLVTGGVTWTYTEPMNQPMRALPIAIGLAVSGLVCLGAGLYAHSRPPRPVLQVSTGQEQWVKPRCSWLGIDGEIWGLIHLCLAILVAWKLREGA
jgi:hypothetical protein